MKRTYALLAALAMVTLAMPAPAAAQGTDFSGTWELDRDASEFPQFGGAGGRDGGPGGGRGGFGGRRGRMAGGAVTLVITQTDAALTVEQQVERGSRTVTYHLDGRESTSTGPRGEQTTTSRWNGAALVTEGTMEMSTPRGDFSMYLVERRFLSDDGQTLTVESIRSTPRGEMTTKLVYTRSEG